MDQIECVSSDGVHVQATITGEGRPLILLPGGIDYEGTGWNKVVPLLARRGYAVVRFVRRFYRPELGDPFQWKMADEARDVAAVAQALGDRVDLVGHSSGGVLTLECLLAHPARYGAAVVFEAPIAYAAPLGGEQLARAREALDAGQPAKAMIIFFRDVVGMPLLPSWLSARGLAAYPQFRARIPGQLADLAAIDAVGDHRDGYRTIAHPILGIMGTKSPAHLGERMQALLAVLPNAESWSVKGGHAAQQRRPNEFADRISQFLRR